MTWENLIFLCWFSCFQNMSMKTIHLQNKIRGQNDHRGKQRSLMQKTEKSEDRQYSLLCSICKSHTMVKWRQAHHLCAWCRFIPAEAGLSLPHKRFWLFPWCQAARLVTRKVCRTQTALPASASCLTLVLLVKAHALTTQACAAGIAFRSH